MRQFVKRTTFKGSWLIGGLGLPAGLLMLAAGCPVGPNTPGPNGRATATPSAAQTPTPTAEPTIAATPTAPPRATPTVEPIDAGTPTPAVTASPTPTAEPVEARITFRAVYQRITDTDALGGGVRFAAMSGDGRRVICYGPQSDDPLVAALYVVADGGSPRQLRIPTGITVLSGLAVNRDGTRAFIAAPVQRSLLKVEGDAVTRLPVGRWCERPETTADGRFVYFAAGRSEVWRVSWDGTDPEPVLVDENVDRDGGPGAGISEYAVSDDGTAIAFVLSGYRDRTGARRQKPELFVQVGPETRQLTNDPTGAGKTSLAISGDGTTIVYRTGWPDNKWYSIKADGSSLTVLAAAGLGAVRPALTQDGTKVFVVDSLSDGGRLLNTDGSGLLDLMPSWKPRALRIAAAESLAISDRGDRISFLYKYAGVPEKYALYVGSLNPASPIEDAPVIRSVGFVPGELSGTDPNARVALVARLSDRQGRDDLVDVGADQILQGRLETDEAILPAVFDEPRDDGKPPDAQADDGYFTALGRPGDKVDEAGEMTVRISAMDTARTVVIADTTLRIGD